MKFSKIREGTVPSRKGTVPFRKGTVPFSQGTVPFFTGNRPLLHLFPHDFVFVAAAIIGALVMAIGHETNHFVFVQIAVADVAFVIVIINIECTGIAAVCICHRDSPPGLDSGFLRRDFTQVRGKCQMLTFAGEYVKKSMGRVCIWGLIRRDCLSEAGTDISCSEAEDTGRGKYAGREVSETPSYGAEGLIIGIGII